MTMNEAKSVLRRIAFADPVPDLSHLIEALRAASVLIGGEVGDHCRLIAGRASLRNTMSVRDYRRIVGDPARGVEILPRKGGV
jgi:hypothetical protein